MVIYDNNPGFLTGLFIAGLSSTIAEVFTIPFDTARVRLQHQNKISVKLKERNIFSPPKYSGIVNTLKIIIREEGSRALFTGLTAGIHRQVIVAVLRIGFYDEIKKFYADKLYDPNRISMQYGARLLSALTTSTIGLCVCQPADIIKTRYLSQFKAPPNVSRFKSLSHAYETIILREGITGLWKGLGGNIKRNALVNVCEVFLYDVIREKVLKGKLMEDTALCHLTCAAATGFITTLITAPFDILSNRMLMAQRNVYKHVIDYGIKMLRKEGLFSFYKGSLPYFARTMSWNIFLWVLLERLKVILQIDIRDIEIKMSLVDPISHATALRKSVQARTRYPPGHPDDPRQF